MSLQLMESTTTATEAWVDLRVVAAHIGFGYQTTRRRVMAGELPGKPFISGKKTFWRCRLSDVDNAIRNGSAQ